MMVFAARPAGCKVSRMMQGFSAVGKEYHQKSPSLAVPGNWVGTVVSTIAPTEARPIEDQLQPLHEVAGRLGWTVVEGISGTKGREVFPTFSEVWLHAI